MHKTYEGKRLFERPRCRWEDNINTDLKGIMYKVVDLSHLTKDRVQWQVLVNMVMNLCVS